VVARIETSITRWIKIFFVSGVSGRKSEPAGGALMDYGVEAVCDAKGEKRVLCAPPEAAARFDVLTLV